MTRAPCAPLPCSSITALTAAAAQISVPLPFTPVPFTLQPMVVLLGGAALGSRLGMSSQVLYLLLGHRGPSGLRRVTRAAAGARAAAGSDRRLSPQLSARRLRHRLAGRARVRSPLLDVGPRDGGRAGNHLRVRCRVARLFAQPAPIGFDAALRTGLYPFLPADILKVLLAATVLPSIWSYTGRR